MFTAWVAKRNGLGVPVAQDVATGFQPAKAAAQPPQSNQGTPKHPTLATLTMSEPIIAGGSVAPRPTAGLDDASRGPAEFISSLFDNSLSAIAESTRQLAPPAGVRSPGH